MKKHLGTISALLCALLLAIPAISAASVNNDQVTSIKLKEADNNGSQDTNSGSGVKTGHIQNNAVTTDKILDGTVGNNDLANGAVTDAKITGPISVGKLPVGTTSGTVAAGDHGHDGLYLKKYGKVAIVAQSGGDYTSPVTAMSNIASWCGTPSSSNPCLLKIMPGIFDLGSGYLSTAQNVDLEGSGENVTILVSSGSYTIIGNDNNEIRLLTAKNTGYNGSAILDDHTSTKLRHVTARSQCADSINCAAIQMIGSSAIMSDVTAIAEGDTTSSAIAIMIWQDSSPVLHNVTAIASGGAINHGIHMESSGSPVLNNVNATASGGAEGNIAILVHTCSPKFDGVIATASGSTSYGVYSYQSSFAITKVTAVGNYGLYAQSASVISVDQSILDGTQSIVNDSGCTVKIGSSKLVGDVAGSGTFACVVTYDGNYGALDSVCQ